MRGVLRDLQRALVVTLACVPSFAHAALAQDAVPHDILQRTYFIKGATEAGTGFEIDHDGRIYLITAKHVVAGLPHTGATLQIWRDNAWADYKTSRTLFPSSDKVDIAVFETDKHASQPFWVSVAGQTGGPTFGQQLWFLGYPWGLGTHLSNIQLPFIKRGTMSAIDASDPQAVILYVDGFNNPGFSGGPILYWDFSQHRYFILGVVQGYREDTAKVLVNGEQLDTRFLVNSGILIGYSIKHAIDAIEAAPAQH